ncbi:MAG: TetR/AcrR family transcriptional regulator [Solirubrobacteraceae bacterium]
MSRPNAPRKPAPPPVQRDRAPVSRRERPAKKALSREAIVDAALAIVTEEGAEALTMRRLATVLDTGAASLYVYVENTGELHAGMLERLLGSFHLSRGRAPWRERLVELLVSYTGLLYGYPVLARTALFTWPSGPNYRNLVEALLALMAEGGVETGRAAWGVDLLLQRATATAAEHATRDESGDAEAEASGLADAIRGASPDTHPHIAAAAGDLLSGGVDRHQWSFEVLINGLLGTPRPGAAESAVRPRT